jgi:type I site-specific restriction endonuclease
LHRFRGRDNVCPNGFLKKDELALMIQRREMRKALAPEDIDRKIVERFYQERAIRRVAEAFERDKHDRRGQRRVEALLRARVANFQ